MITILPAIDVMGGACVRLTEGDFDSKIIYYKNPLDAARQLEDAGFRHLHLIDLDNARDGQILSLDVLETIASRTHLQIDYGGGVKTSADLDRVIAAGARQVNCGSLALTQPELFETFVRNDADRIILSADARDGFISTSGWKDQSAITLIDFIQEKANQGLRYVTSTDIAKDGRLEGPNFEMYRKLKSHFPKLNICASGGISCIDDIIQLAEMKIERVIVGKAIYEGKISMAELHNLDADA